ncbi:hypothetical protein [Vibrio bathopelagicus]
MLELDIGLKLADKLLELLRERDKNKEKELKERKDIFNDFIQPIYSDVEVIRQNYSLIFYNIQKRLADDKTDLESTIEELKLLRMELEPLREKTRAVSITFYRSLESKGISFDDTVDCAIVEFISSVGRIIGSTSCAGFQALEISPAHMFFDVSATYNLLYTLQGTSRSEKIGVQVGEMTRREEGQIHVNQIINQHAIGWHDVVSNYAILKAELCLK